MQQVIKPIGPFGQIIDQQLPFAEYLTTIRSTIKHARRHQPNLNSDMIIDANTPYEWHPVPFNKADHYKNGILLIHGLYDSPFSMRDIAQYFLQQGFFVRTILLPGHGTTPQSMLQVNHQDWLDAVEYGISRISKRVDNLIIGGFSMGAALSLLTANTTENCRGLLLFAPAVKAKHPLAEITRFHRLFTWISEKLNWYAEFDNNNYVKYHQHAFHSAHQALKVMRLARQQPLLIPTFSVLSADDETISSAAFLEHFNNSQDPRHRLIYYGNSSLKTTDQRIECRKSQYPEQQIINFSHPCIPISPTNHYLGMNGELLASMTTSKKMVYGASTASNIKLYKHHLARLSYNPDFIHMMNCAMTFIQSVIPQDA